MKQRARCQQGFALIHRVVWCSAWAGLCWACSSEQPGSGPVAGAGMRAGFSEPATMLMPGSSEIMTHDAMPPVIAMPVAGKPAVAPTVPAAGDQAASSTPAPAPAPMVMPMSPAHPHDAASGDRAVPDDVCHALQANGCIGCHRQPLQGGAPMALQWQANFRGSAQDGTPLAAKLLARITDATAPMPPVTTQRPLPSAEHVATLRKWLDAGMPAAAGGACEASALTPDNTPAWAKGAWPEGECEYVMTVGAHGVVGTSATEDLTGYEPPTGETSYRCFYEKAPWGDKPVQALATRVHVDGADDQAVVHHLIVSAISAESGMSFLGGTAPTKSGDAQDCVNTSGSTVAVWAPGALEQLTFPKETGLLLPSGDGAYLEMQVHYNHAKAGMSSRVSLDICATTRVRTNTAAVHWLGYENATVAVPLGALAPELQPVLDNQGGGVAVGQCVAKKRAQILWTVPHMHARGKHAKVEILRKNGSTQLIHDAPFDYHEQTTYLYDELWIDPGETIRTTCTWDTERKIVFGFGSNDEMCYLFTLATPVGALAGEGAELGLPGGSLNCAGAN